jgi:VWFA-related protein
VLFQRFSAWVFLAILAGFLVKPVFSQQQDSPQQDSEEATIRVDVSVVNILCTVRDRDGGLVATLDKTDFDVREDGKRQEIVYFSRETTLPLTLGLLVDSSVSQQRLIPDEQRAAASFLEQVLTPQDAAFLISFDVNVDLLQDITGSVNFLRQALDRIRINSGGGPGSAGGPFPQMQTGGTHLFDAVYLAADEVLRSEAGRKAIILISDGQDHGSMVSRELAIEAAQRADVIVYGILFYDRDFYGWGGSGYRGDGVLKKMAEETGGRVIEARNDSQLQGAFQEISDELRSQYSVGYSPTNAARDGSYRNVQVRVNGRGYRVQARKGYYAPGGD